MARKPEAAERRRGRWAATLLAPVADVRPHEASTALVMGAQAFILLGAYYLLKPVREAWILPGGAELKTYLAAVQAVALLAIAKGYDAVARRVRRDRLVAIATGIAIACLVGFHALASAGCDVAVAFYLWLGAFQLLLIAQFWSFATDLYTPEQGRRIFAVLGSGAALGSVLGAQLARVAMRALDDPARLLLVAALLLGLVPVLAAVAHRRSAHGRRSGDPPAPPAVAVPPEAGSSRSLLARVLGDPYLRLVALFTLLLNAVGTLGEYALDRTLLEAALAAVARGSAVSVEQYVGAFKADLYAAVNVVVLLLQLFAASRVIRVLGERMALAVLPLAVLAGAVGALGALGLAAPMLAVLGAQRVIESGITHSIQSTARQGLYLLTTREGRWVGKAFIDTVTWRAGDVVGALGVAALAAADAGTAEALLLVLGLAVD